MKKILLVLLIAVPSAVWAQGTLGLRFEGGVSWMQGGGIEGASAKTLTAIQPQAGAGFFFNFNILLNRFVVSKHTECSIQFVS